MPIDRRAAAAALDAAVIAYALSAADVGQRVQRFADAAGLPYVAALRRVGDEWRGRFPRGRQLATARQFDTRWSST